MQLPNDSDQQYYQEERLFNALDAESIGVIKKKLFLLQFEETGISIHDKRLAKVKQRLDSVRGDSLSRKDFCHIIAPAFEIVRKIITRQLVIPEWPKFKENIKDLYHQVKIMKGGENATYIPELARQDPNLFSVCFCSIDGQTLWLGDSESRYSVQSSSKPIALLVALAELGEQGVHRFVGREPSGRNFNELCLNSENIPHNPMINAGAIMTCSLIKTREVQSTRFRHLMKYWHALVGDDLAVTFSNTTYLSERATADRNFCLGYMMQGVNAFQYGQRKDLKPRTWDSYDLVKNLELYFQSCSIEIDPKSHSILASTLANGGVCPLTGVRVFDAHHVRNALSLMLSCGMYDYSGEWAYTIGLPAKSGVSGCIIVAVPNVGGFCIFSPPLDAIGNSFKGIEFCKLLVQTFTFHYYDMVNSHMSHGKKYNPCKIVSVTKQSSLLSLCYACAKGDLPTIKSLLSAGADINAGDYDGRTPIHLAASEGKYVIVKFLIAKGSKLDPIDRWGNTPQMDAVREGHQKIAKYLSSRILRKNIIGGHRRRSENSSDPHF